MFQRQNPAIFMRRDKRERAGKRGGAYGIVELGAGGGAVLLRVRVGAGLVGLDGAGGLVQVA